MLVVSVLGVLDLPREGFWLCMLIMVVYWFSSWCRYFGHSVVGLYCMVLGGMVAIMCTFACVTGRRFSL